MKAAAWRRVAVALSCWGVCFACGGNTEGESPPSCTAETAEACVGPSGCEGSRVCKSDGSGFGACECSGEQQCHSNASNDVSMLMEAEAALANTAEQFRQDVSNACAALAGEAPVDNPTDDDVEYLCAAARAATRAQQLASGNAFYVTVQDGLCADAMAAQEECASDCGMSAVCIEACGVLARLEAECTPASVDVVGRESVDAEFVALVEANLPILIPRVGELSWRARSAAANLLEITGEFASELPLPCVAVHGAMLADLADRAAESATSLDIVRQSSASVLEVVVADDL